MRMMIPAIPPAMPPMMIPVWPLLASSVEEPLLAVVPFSVGVVGGGVVMICVMTGGAASVAFVVLLAAVTFAVGLGLLAGTTGVGVVTGAVALGLGATAGLFEVEFVGAGAGAAAVALVGAGAGRIEVALLGFGFVSGLEPLPLLVAVVGFVVGSTDGSLVEVMVLGAAGAASLVSAEWEVGVGNASSIPRESCLGAPVLRSWCAMVEMKAGSDEVEGKGISAAQYQQCKAMRAAAL